MLDLVVIGGGIAGLTAARDAARLGVNVTVLEARGRIGGQIYSCTHPDIPQQVQLGAEFYNRTAHSNVEAELKKYSIAVDSFNSEREYYLRRVKKIIKARHVKKAMMEEEGYRRAMQLINQHASYLNIASGYEQLNSDIYDIPLRIYLQERVGANGDVLDFLLSQAFLLGGGDPDTISALAFLVMVANLNSAENALGMNDSELYYTLPETKRFAYVQAVPADVGSGMTSSSNSGNTNGGIKSNKKTDPVTCNPHAMTSVGDAMQRLVECMAKEILSLGGVIHRNCTVVSITANETQVEQPKVPNYDFPPLPKIQKLVQIGLREGEQLTARGVIVAVPLRCLPNIHFDPPLPGEVVRASSVCQAGHQYLKVWTYVSGISQRINRVLSSTYPLRDCYVTARYYHSLEQQRMKGIRSPSGRRKNARELSPLSSRRSSRVSSPIPSPVPGSSRRRTRSKGKSRDRKRSAQDTTTPPKSFNTVNKPSNWSDMFEVSSLLDQERKNNDQVLEPFTKLRIATPSSGHMSPFEGSRAIRSAEEDYKFAMVCGVGLRDEFLTRIQASFCDIHPAVEFPLPHLRITPASVELSGSSQYRVGRKGTKGQSMMERRSTINRNKYEDNYIVEGSDDLPTTLDAAEHLESEMSDSAILYHDFYTDRYTKGSWFALRAGTALIHAAACKASEYPWKNVTTETHYTETMSALQDEQSRVDRHRQQQQFMEGRSMSVNYKSSAFNPNPGVRPVVPITSTFSSRDREDERLAGKKSTHLQQQARNEQKRAQEAELNRSLMLIGSELCAEWTGWVEGGIRSGQRAAVKMHQYLYPSRIARHHVRRIYPGDDVRYCEISSNNNSDSKNCN